MLSRDKTNRKIYRPEKNLSPPISDNKKKATMALKSTHLTSFLGVFFPFFFFFFFLLHFSPGSFFLSIFFSLPKTSIVLVEDFWTASCSCAVGTACFSLCLRPPMAAAELNKPPSLPPYPEVLLIQALMKVSQLIIEKEKVDVLSLVILCLTALAVHLAQLNFTVIELNSQSFVP